MLTNPPKIKTRTDLYGHYMHEKMDAIILLKFSNSLTGLGTKERQLATVALDI